MKRRRVLQAGGVAAAGHFLKPGQDSPRWGSSFRGAMPATEGVPVNLFDWPDSVKLVEPEMVSVNVLSSRNIGATNGDFRLRVYAGGGAITNIFDCDLGEGLQFGIVAQTLRLELVSFRPSWGTLPATLAPYDPANGDAQVTAEVVLGSAARGAPLTYTEASRRFDPGTGANYAVPPYARRLFIMSNVWGQADATLVNWALRTPANFNVGGNMNTPFSAGGYVPVPAGVNVLRIDNTSANDYDVTPVWELAL